MQLLTSRLAQDIVDRTMQIIPFNVNVMDARGAILASGDAARIGQLHAGALLALARQGTVEVDAASVRNLHGARPGINLPLTVNGAICGAIGLSGAPDQVRQFGELVRLTAEMILEQASLVGELQRDARYREALLLDLIKPGPSSPADLAAWARRLGLDFQAPHAIVLLRFGDAQLDAETALGSLQRMQLRLRERDPAALTAIVGPREMALLEGRAGAASDAAPQARRRLRALAALLGEDSAYPLRLTTGIALPGIDGVAISYQTAQAASRIGQRRDPGQALLHYDDLALPVLLSELGGSWQAAQLRLPIERLRAGGRSHQVLRRTLDAWFAHDGHPAATAGALHIHRNTLDYRLRRIGELTGLDLARMEHRVLLYIGAQLEA